MRKLLVSLVLLIFSENVTANRVEQVHLSLSGKMDEMVVTWLTQGPLPNVTPYVMYGLSKDALRWTAKATTTSWKDQGSHGYVRYTHRATMTKMVPGDTYYYKVGSSQDMSDVYHFHQPDPTQPLRAAIFGDLSVYKGAPSIKQLTDATHDNHFDVIIHIGDIAYDLHDDEGNRGDDYMNAVQPFAAYVPYMVFAGNHESDSHFNQIINRFTMPKNGVYDNNLFWSFDYGLTHFIGLNSEYYAEIHTKEAQAQYKWLQADLAKNKAQWTIVMFHRPWYCSTKDKGGCNDYLDMLSRKGNSELPGLEKLLFDHKVDMVLYGHKHTYERMWPIYDGTGYKSSDSGHIRNAKAPVYILTGSAGCHTHEGPSDAPQSFSATRLGQYGYTRLKVYNTTHLSTYFVDTSDKVGNFMDKFYLEKD
ncbi:Purple acid phosphatase [Caenorhabditis elegans]|uniref:Purple acid phosphatase n=2 Tax=Caenorhabditis elegans TaxID=6239 RepID=Q9U309_CAEEL|nr:Purple acid phosphatase [Caenorhabditis elegans]CAB60319.1 Purple acid phosphatase [Caenorhabditis elegans]|eukprot:NP_502904.1 Purple acid phosphatase [Caenorhabditis elegans]